MTDTEDVLVDFFPKQTGEYVIHILYNDVAILNSPFTSKVYDINQIKVSGDKTNSRIQFSLLKTISQSFPKKKQGERDAKNNSAKYAGHVFRYESSNLQLYS